MDRMTGLTIPFTKEEDKYVVILDTHSPQHSLFTFSAINLPDASGFAIFLHYDRRLILDARNLGKTFTDIARMLPARNVTTLRKHYAIISKPKVLLTPLHCFTNTTHGIRSTALQQCHASM